MTKTKCHIRDMGGEGAMEVFNSWTLKLVWNVPRATRTFLAQNVLSCGLYIYRFIVSGKDSYK